MKPLQPFYGAFEVRWFSVESEDWLTGASARWPKTVFSPSWLRECRAVGGGQPWAWDGRSPAPTRGLTSQERPVFDELVRLFGREFPRQTRLRRWVPFLQEVLQSPLVDDEDKAALLVSDSARSVWDEVATSLPQSLHPRLREVFRLEAQWTDLDREVTPSLRKMAEVLAEPERIAGWEDIRRQGFEDRRLAAERLRLEEEALRAALTLGRRGPDQGPMVVTDEFKQAFRALKAGTRLLFVTGKPGTGKSTFIRALREEWKHRNLSVTAFTGAAALNVEGQTLHSFFWLPPRLITPGSLEAPGYKLKVKLQALEVLVIDEVSMVRPDVMDAVDGRLRTCRGDSRPFGGVTVVLVGDLYQLPPVIGRDDEDETKWMAQAYPRGRWFHAARVFDRLKPAKLELTRVFRQTQTEFLKFLAAVREGVLTAEELDKFNDQVRSRLPFSPLEFHTLIVPHNKDVTLHNQRRLELLGGEARTYAAQITGEEPRDSETRYPADRELVLKPRAQVLFLRNDPGGRWVNGDFGIVEALEAEVLVITSGSGKHRVERATRDLGKYELDPATKHLGLQKTGTFRQFPVRLSWALTIHKMQGQTVDRMVLDLGTGAFEPGMTYVALSRVRTLEGLRLSRPLVAGDLAVDPTVKVWLDGLEGLEM